jgi:hypothetical protein
MLAEMRHVIWSTLAVAVLAFGATARAATGELEQARAIGKRIVALYKTPAGLCKLGTVAGDPCTASVRAELAPIFEAYAPEIHAIGLKSLRRIAPHRYRSSLGTFAGKPFNLTLRKAGGRWQLLDEDTGQWFTVPAWLR